MKKIYRHIKFLAAAIILIGSCGCGNDEPETPPTPDTPDQPEQPEIIPFSQKELNTRTVSENPGAYYEPEDVDPENFDIRKLFNMWYSDPNHYEIYGGFFFAAVQVKTDEGAIYSFCPTLTPIYISATGTAIRLRHVCQESSESGIFLGMLNSGLGQCTQEITKEEAADYNIREQDGDIYLSFPENKSDQFKMLTVSVSTFQLYPSPGSDGHSLLPASNWFCFLQMPWTDDEAIWENIPEVETFP